MKKITKKFRKWFDVAVGLLVLVYALLVIVNVFPPDLKMIEVFVLYTWIWVCFPSEKKDPIMEALANLAERSESPVTLTIEKKKPVEVTVENDIVFATKRVDNNADEKRT